MTHEKVIQLVHALARAFALLSILCFATLSVILYVENKKLLVDNERLRIVNSSTAKVVYKHGVNDKRELERIAPAADMFIVDPYFLLAIRQLENGRELLEFGCHNVNARIKKTVAPSEFQYYESAYTIAFSQRAFALANFDAFVTFVAATYCPKNKVAWKRDVYENFRKLHENSTKEKKKLKK